MIYNPDLEDPIQALPSLSMAELVPSIALFDELIHPF